MPSIRLPATIEPLLPFCRKFEDAVEHACFDTYADLLVFAAAFGFHHLAGAKPSPPKELLETPYPIDLAIFKNQQNFSQLILIGLATEGTQDIARDEEKLCHLIEAFASEGGKALTQELNDSTPASFYLDLANLLEEASKGEPVDQI
jgi:hypothetical protein